MPKKKLFSQDQIPAHFKKLIEVYGFADEDLMAKAVATRSAEEWFAILFHNKDTGEMFAVDFKFYGGPDNNEPFSQRFEGWEIQNDDAGSFESVEEFLNTKLTRGFF